jgi:alpha-glucoside transport system substrate-binding protein
VGDPVAAAREAAGGEQLGGTLNIVGVWGGPERESFLATVAPFEEATGTTVDYEDVRNLNSVLRIRVNGGDPPDIAALPSISQIADWAGQDNLVDLSKFIDAQQLAKDNGQSWVELGTVDGKLVALFTWASLKGPIWYNPKTYDGPAPPASWDELQAWAQQKAASGVTPWCIGLESGAASGWPGTDWIEDILLRQAGPEKYDEWWQGQLKWTSPEVRAAFETFGEIAADPTMVFGGPTSVLTTRAGEAGDPLFTDPPGCFLHHQASFITDFFLRGTSGIQPVEDFNFFIFPDINPEYAGSIEVVGDSFSMFKDTPQARAFMKYMATPEAQALWVNRGGKLPVNKQVSLDAYPDQLAQTAGEIITGAQTVRFDASDLMPEAMSEAFWQAVLDYVENPDDLDDILAELEEVQQEAYSQ